MLSPLREIPAVGSDDFSRLHRGAHPDEVHDVQISACFT